MNRWDIRSVPYVVRKSPNFIQSVGIFVDLATMAKEAKSIVWRWRRQQGNCVPTNWAVQTRETGVGYVSITALQSLNVVMKSVNVLKANSINVSKKRVSKILLCGPHHIIECNCSTGTCFSQVRRKWFLIMIINKIINTDTININLLLLFLFLRRPSNSWMIQTSQ